MKNLATVILVPIIGAIGMFALAALYYAIAMQGLAWLDQPSPNIPQPPAGITPYDMRGTLAERAMMMASLTGIPLGALLIALRWQRPDQLLKKDGQPDRLALAIGIGTSVTLCVLAVYLASTFAHALPRTSGFVASLGFLLIAHRMIESVRGWK
jgi:hypothetical protein